MAKPVRSAGVAQGAAQGYCSNVPEAQGSGPLALSVVALVDALVERRADGAALAGLLDHKQPLVDLAGFVDQFGEVVQASVDLEVVGLVDDGLDPKRPAVFEVLLDAGVLVAEVDPDLVVASGAHWHGSSWWSRSAGRLIDSVADVDQCLPVGLGQARPLANVVGCRSPWSRFCVRGPV